MKTTEPKQHRPTVGFTLLEILAVIAIIGILISILLPAIARSKTRAMVGLAKIDCKTIANAIKAYRDEYSRYPTIKGQGSNPTTKDLTYSHWYPDPAGTDAIGYHNGTITGYPSNSHAISILIDNTDLPITTPPDPTTGANMPHPNAHHSANYKKRAFFEPKMSGSNEEQGIYKEDGVFRDPFGNPYIISVDFNNDNKCYDETYKILGGEALMKDTSPSNLGYYLPGTVMVWSAGPDFMIDNGQANGGVNKDNILGWE